MALNLRRYNRRHDAVLEVIADMVQSNLAPNQQMTVDLPGNNYLFPQHIGRTESHPDLVVWEDDARMVTMIELTVCFETNFNDAQRRKFYHCNHPSVILRLLQALWRETVTPPYPQ